MAVTDTKPRRAVFHDNRERILDAARDLFAERGYRGTTTRELAVAAGVAEPTLFRHFPSKAELFDAAVVGPVQAVLEDFFARHRERPIGERDEIEATRAFYGELYDELDRDAKLLVALVAALSFDESDTELAAQLRPTLQGLLKDLDAHFAAEFGARRFPIDPSLALRIMMATILGTVVHGDWLFPEGKRPDRDTLVDGMAYLTVYGLSGAR